MYLTPLFPLGGRGGGRHGGGARAGRRAGLPAAGGALAGGAAAQRAALPRAAGNDTGSVQLWAGGRRVEVADVRALT